VAAKVEPGQEVIVGFGSQAARLALSEEPTPAETIAIAAQVVNAEPNFAQRHQLVNVESGGQFFGVAMPLEEPINAGWRVQVLAPHAATYFFDAASEQRIRPA